MLDQKRLRGRLGTFGEFPLIDGLAQMVGDLAEGDGKAKVGLCSRFTTALVGLGLTLPAGVVPLWVLHHVIDMNERIHHPPHDEYDKGHREPEDNLLRYFPSPRYLIDPSPSRRR